MTTIRITLALIFLLLSPCLSQEDMDGGEEQKEEENKFVAKGEYVQTDGKKKSCSNQEDCYDQREPPAWCRPNEDQKWTDRGCFCDENEKSCMIERNNAGKLEHTDCADEKGWVCE